MNQPQKSRQSKPHITVVNRDMMSEIEKVGSRLSLIERLLYEFNIRDILMTMTKPRRLLWLNFIAGISRGLGMTVGTAIVLGFIFIILKSSASLPIIGDYIDQLLNLLKEYRVEQYRY